MIALETLSVKTLLGHRRLSKAIGDTGWSEVFRQVRYKAAWYVLQAVGIDRFAPGGKRCSACGAVHNQHISAAINAWPQAVWC